MSKTGETKPQVQIIEKKLVWDGFVKMHKVTAKIPSVHNDQTIEITREIHDHGNAVAVLPVDKTRKKALMVGQWRIPAYLNGHKERIWEAPAGLIDPGETPIECAKREALEETGYQVSNLRFICSPFASPGLVTEKVDIFLADYSETSQVSQSVGVDEEGEDIELAEFSFQELFELIDHGKIFDATTVIAIYALREELRAK